MNYRTRFFLSQSRLWKTMQKKFDISQKKPERYAFPQFKLRRSDGENKLISAKKSIPHAQTRFLVGTKGNKFLLCIPVCVE